MKRGGLALRNFRRLAEHLRRTRLVEPRGAAAALVVIAQRLQQSERAQPDHVRGVFRLIERDAHVRLRRQVVHLVGTDLLDDPPQPGPVAKIAVMQLQAAGAGSVALAQMIDSPGREARGAAHHPMHLVALLQQRLGEVGTVLSGDAGY